MVSTIFILYDSANGNFIIEILINEKMKNPARRGIARSDKSVVVPVLYIQENPFSGCYSVLHTWLAIFDRHIKNKKFFTFIKIATHYL
jgi:hypothetical protein